MPEGQSPTALEPAAIAARFGVSEKTADAWTRLGNFPHSLAKGSWDRVDVDRWVQANRPQSWPPTPTDAGQQPRGRARRPSGKSAHTGRTERISDIARRFGRTPGAVTAWTKVSGDGVSKRATAFPPPVAPHAYDPDQVDAWVQANRPQVWAAVTVGTPVMVVQPPEGHPKDLLDIDEYGAILGNATRGRPLARGTMTSYYSRKQIAQPDRTPNDKLKPKVFKPMWYRQTIEADVRRRWRTRGKAAGTTTS